MRHKLQKQSAMKFACRIIPEAKRSGIMRDNLVITKKEDYLREG
jgi:hypothetical protein